MKQILMHKDVRVAETETSGGKITGIIRVFEEEHLPVGVPRGISQALQLAYLQAWQRERAIPSDRHGLEYILGKAGMDIFGLCVLSHGMGLTDCYWFCNPSESLTWNDMDFRTNGFQESTLTLDGEGQPCNTPDYETDGCLPKCWVGINGVPSLLKAPTPYMSTVCANEVVAFLLADLIGIKHCMYVPISFRGKMLCTSPCFVEGNEEFVPMKAHMRQRRGKPLEAEVQKLGMWEAVREMTAFDLLIGNTDRHEGNFGYIRDADTLEFLRPAPLFDSGMCLHYAWNKDRFVRPFCDDRESAYTILGEAIPFGLPDAAEAAIVVRETYRTFGLEQHTEGAVSELLRNIQEMRDFSAKSET